MFDEEAALVHGTDEYWVQRLSTALVAKFPRLVLLDQWAVGKPPIPKTTKVDTPGMIKMREMSRLNLAKTIKGQPLNKMKVVGFKTAATDDENGDTAAAKIWHRNDMKNVIKLTLDWMLLYGESYALVGYEEVNGKREAIITEESPYEVITIQDPVRKSKTKYALKMYRDDIDDVPTDKLVLYRFNESGLPTSRVLSLEGDTVLPAKDATEWKISGDWEWSEPEVIEMSKLPVQRFSTMDNKGIFEDFLPTMTRINEGIFHRMWIGLTQAQRVLMLIGPEEKVPEGGSKTYFDAANETSSPASEKDLYGPEEEDDSLFGAIDLTPGSVNELPFGSVPWQGQPTDIRQLLEESKDDIRYLGEETGTQFAFAISEAVNMSSAGASSIRRRGDEMADELRDLSEACIAELMSRSFEVEGDTVRSESGEIRVMWATIDDSTILEKAQASKAAKEGSMPFRTRMKKIWNMSPDELAEVEADAMSESFMQPTTTTTPPTPIAQEVTTDGNTDTTVTDQIAN